MKQAAFFLSLGVVAMLVGCTTRPTGSSVYSPSRINQSYTNFPGVVLGVKHVTIEGTKSATGAIAGGAVGGGVGIAAAGGGGVGGAVAAGVGSAAGAIVGQEIEKMVTAKRGLEITVQLDNGDVLVVIQEEDFTFRDGDRVTVQVGSGGYTRVLP